MQLYLVRHGQSENNLLWDQTASSKGRSDDPELTATGRTQAERLARFLTERPLNGDSGARSTQNRNGFGITHIYSSLMVRAVATGSAVARAAGLPLQAWEDFHEGGGIYLDDEASGQPLGQPGKDRAYFAAHYPELVLPDGKYEDGWYDRPYETVDQRRARARRVLCELSARQAAGDRIVAITHGEFYNYLLAEVFDLPNPPESRYWFALNNAGLTRIDFENNSIVPMYMNRVDFLPTELLT
jgi:2,3-bisphosphoglycerate-dependent phosphoglycerate mutase